MSITIRPFGQTSDGRPVSLYTMTNASGASVALTDLGARLVSVFVPDRNGKLEDVCIGFDDASVYETKVGASVGATIGRVANRIGGAAFELNGKKYTVPANDGPNCLHGGPKGFHTYMWQAECHEGAQADYISFRLESKDGDAGFPGTMQIETIFAWTEENELCISYHAIADQDTLCNLTNHAYFNMDACGNTLDHSIQINADLITVTDDALIPTGEELDVTGLSADLRKPVTLRDGMSRGADFPLIIKKNGYDFNYRLQGDGFRSAAVLRGAVSGRKLHVCTTEPCIQLYTGQHFDIDGHNGCHYGPWAGIALETQHHPDAIHHENFPSVVLPAGKAFSSQTVFSFSVEA
ncbi:MAG: galactose mutarotase [Clostridia bacterium]|nr:galactose mutarotase [Clostridia bacterium]